MKANSRSKQSIRSPQRRTFLSVAGAAICFAAVFSIHAEEKKEIAVIPMGTTQAYWKTVEQGAKQAAKDFDIDMKWKGPLKESDRAGQIAIVEQFVSDGVDGIVLAPLDRTALKRPVAAAMAKGIPVVIIDTPLEGDAGKDFVSTVATNNKRGGEMAAEELGRLLDGKGKVILLRHQEGVGSTTLREAGFLEGIKKIPGIEVILDNRYAGATASEAQSTALNILDKIKEADGIFCPNESSTFGCLLALRQNNLAGKVKLIGFDTSPPLIEAIKKGEVQAVVAQNPKKMAHEGVKLVLEKIKGQEVPPLVDSGAVLVTKENLDTPEIQELIK
jgi:ribose transport system substrate-binding protein